MLRHAALLPAFMDKITVLLSHELYTASLVEPTDFKNILFLRFPLLLSLLVHTMKRDAIHYLWPGR